MRFYKTEDNRYIVSIGTGNGGTEITEPEFNEIMTVIQNKPEETETIGYRLKTDLTWEQYEKESIPEPEEIDDTEALSILLGGDPE